MLDKNMPDVKLMLEELKLMPESSGGFSPKASTEFWRRACEAQTQILNPKP